MRLILTILFVLSGAISFAQDASCPSEISLEGMSGLMRNAYLSVDWVNPDTFTYCVETDAGREYYMADVKSWKPRKMFETSEFVGRLNELSEKTVEVTDFRLSNPDFDKKNPDVFSFSYKKGYYRYDIRTKELTKSEAPQKKPFKKK